MSKELTIKSDSIVPALNGDIGEAIQEEMEGLPTSFDRVKIPSGGGVAFEVPGDDPESPDLVKELVGVIVDHHPVNACWEQKFEGQSNPPDCSSLDAKCGTGIPGGNCTSCPLNQWGTSVNPDGTKGKGKACKNTHRIYILRSGEISPLLLTLPPTSIKPFADYMAKRIIMKGRRSYSVVTKITLKRAQNSVGITYSQAQFAMDSILDKDTAAKMKQYSQEIKQTTRQLGATSADYDDEPTDKFPKMSDDDKAMPF